MIFQEAMGTVKSRGMVQKWETEKGCFGAGQAGHCEKHCLALKGRTNWRSWTPLKFQPQIIKTTFSEPQGQVVAQPQNCNPAFQF